MEKNWITQLQILIFVVLKIQVLPVFDHQEIQDDKSGRDWNVCQIAK